MCGMPQVDLEGATQSELPCDHITKLSSLAFSRFRVASSVLVFCLPAARCPSPAASFAAFFFPPALSPAPCFLLCPSCHTWMGTTVK